MDLPLVSLLVLMARAKDPLSPQLFVVVMEALSRMVFAIVDWELL